MTPAELRAALGMIGWSGRELAIRINSHRNLPLAWLSGRKAIPVTIAAWVEQLAQFHEHHPAPEWRQFERIDR